MTFGMMTSPVAILLICLLPFVACYSIMDNVADQEYDVDDPYTYSERGALNAFNQVQRRRNWCARWGDNCMKNAKVQLARCCDGMSCVCGRLWSDKKCTCRSHGSFGR